MEKSSQKNCAPCSKARSKEKKKKANHKVGKKKAAVSNQTNFNVRALQEAEIVYKIGQFLLPAQFSAKTESVVSSA